MLASRPQADTTPHTVDVLVAGSGAAGLMAAITCAARGLDVLVCERAATIGGTTALSGGRVWIPGHHLQAAPDEDLRLARTYLETIFDARFGNMMDAVLASGPAMVREVEDRTPHRFVPCPNYPDYHPDRTGASLGGRCLDMRPLDLTGLTHLAELVRIPPGYLPISHAEWERWRWPDQYDWALIESRLAARVASGGPALTAALLDGAVTAGARVVTGHRVVDVEPRPDGRVVATVDAGGVELSIVAGHVVLATGGYDQDAELRGQYLPAALGASGSSPSNTGDALRIARRLGADLANLDQGWWMPMVQLPGEEVDGVAAYRSVIRERGTPRMILVDRSGRRFMDEASPYNEFGKVMHRRDGDGEYRRDGDGEYRRDGDGEYRRDGDGEYRHAEAFLVFDAGFRRRYPLPGLRPDDPDPGWLACAPTPRALAELIGVDPAGLTDQIHRWNDACATGVDAEFDRGGNPYDRYYGDPRQPGNPNLGPLDEAPYYALRLYSGTIGSKGGPVTDVDGRVLDGQRAPIPGVFAVGNAAAFWTADGYPGPGATLGVGMTMGFRAGLAITGAGASSTPTRPSHDAVSVPTRRGESTVMEVPHGG